MEILFIRDNPVNPDVRVEKEIKSLLEDKHRISILAWDKSNNEYENVKIIDGVKIPIERCKIKCSYGGGFKRNIIPLVRFQFFIIKYLLKNKNRFDVVHACDFNTAFTTAIICKFIKKPFIYDIFDYYVDTFDVPNSLKKIVVKLDHWVIKKSKTTILCSEQRIEQVNMGYDWPFVIIHNSPENVNISNDLIEVKGEKEKFKIVYVGALAKKRKLELLVDAVREIENVEFHVAGFGELEEEFKQWNTKGSNVVYYGKINYNQTLSLENKCDAMVALYPINVRNHIYAAPNKFYEALMLGKPIMMIKGSGMSNIVEENDFGCVVVDTKESIMEGIEKLKYKKNDLTISGEMKEMFLKDYEWKIMGERLKQIYRKIEKDNKNVE